MIPKVIRFVRLENTTTRKAWYEVTLEEHGGAYKVRTAFGPLGKKAIKDQLTGDYGFRMAESFFTGKIKDKLSGGYVKTRDESTASSGPGAPAPITVSLPSGPPPEDEKIVEESIFKGTPAEEKWAKRKKEVANAAPWGNRKK
jgi:hypothetical protein